MEVVSSQTSYIDEVSHLLNGQTTCAAFLLEMRMTKARQRDVEKARLVYGMDLGTTVADGDDEESAEGSSITSARKVGPGSRVRCSGFFVELSVPNISLRSSILPKKFVLSAH